MMKRKTLQIALALVFTLGLSVSVQSQNVAISNDGSDPDPSAMLDIKAEAMGLLIPRIIESNRPASPATGLLIFQIDNGPGFYFYDGTGWQKIEDLAKVEALIMAETTDRENADLAIQDELDGTQTSSGLGTDGSYTANSASNYIKTAGSLKDADDKLDAQMKTNADGIAANASDISTNETNITTNTNNISSNDTDISNLQTELDGTQSGSGLGTDGSYTANSASNYIKTAGSLKDADDKLDAQMKTNADGIATNASGISTNETNITTNTNNIHSNDTDISNLQTELDGTQSGSGLGTDGSYTANGTANYISDATTLQDADNKLDAQVKTNAGNIATNTNNINTLTDNFGTAGTVVASKAVVVDTNRDIENFNNIQVDGTITSGSSIVIDGTGATQGTISESHGKISFDDETLVTSGKIGVGTTSPNPSAAVEINSTTMGFLPPRMTEAQRDAIDSPADGLVIFNITSIGLEYAFDGLWYNTKGELLGDYVKNPVTGKIWMDRNLGASQVATSYNDSEAYGDLYQWGRLTDGHEKRNSVTTTILSNANDPGHGDFIKNPDDPWDWRVPQNDNLWQGVDMINNPCPAGFRIPTKNEWEAERLTWSSNDRAGAFGSPLKLPAAGSREGDGSKTGVGTSGAYWSSTPLGGSWALNFWHDDAYMQNNTRVKGFSVRCIKE